MLEIWLAFSAGLAGSGHCLGMCGGIVTALSLAGGNRNPAERFIYNLLYHVGRICTYTLLGFMAGFIAQAGMGDLLRPYTNWLFLLANLFVFFIGIFTIVGARSVGIFSLDGCGTGFMQRLLARVTLQNYLSAAFPAGLLMGLLPCGLLYGLLISAATSGSMLKGGAMMLAFGAGTLPVLLAYGQVASTLSALGRGVFQRGMGGVIALLGMVGIWKSLLKLGYF